MQASPKSPNIATQNKYNTQANQFAQDKANSTQSQTPKPTVQPSISSSTSTQKPTNWFLKRAMEINQAKFNSDITPPTKQKSSSTIPPTSQPNSSIKNPTLPQTTPIASISSQAKTFQKSSIDANSNLSTCYQHFEANRFQSKLQAITMQNNDLRANKSDTVHFIPFGKRALVLEIAVPDSNNKIQIEYNGIDLSNTLSDLKDVKLHKKKYLQLNDEDKEFLDTLKKNRSSDSGQLTGKGKIYKAYPLNRVNNFAYHHKVKSIGSEIKYIRNELISNDPSRETSNKVSIKQLEGKFTNCDVIRKELAKIQTNINTSPTIFKENKLRIMKKSFQTFCEQVLFNLIIGHCSTCNLDEILTTYSKLLEIVNVKIDHYKKEIEQNCHDRTSVTIDAKNQPKNRPVNYVVQEKETHKEIELSSEKFKDIEVLFPPDA